MSTIYLSSALDVAENKAKYDAQVRRILADKIILAWILKYCTEEFKDCSIEKIAAAIEEEPELVTVPVYPGKKRTEAIAGLHNEDTVPGEGTIRYDILFYARVPYGESAKLLIDVEAQKKFNPGYSLVTRGVFYCARMLSSQFGTEFTPNAYDDIKKVYSIWICMDAPDYAVDTIVKYSIKPENIAGNFQGKERHDLLTVVMVCLGREEDNNKGTELHRLLSVLLSEKLLPEEKKRILHNEFDINMESDMEEAWNSMCNLSDLIEERAIERGIEQGIEQGIERGQLLMLKCLIEDGKLTWEQAADTMKMQVSELEQTLDRLK